MFMPSLQALTTVMWAGKAGTTQKQSVPVRALRSLRSVPCRVTEFGRLVQLREAVLLQRFHCQLLSATHMQKFVFAEFRRKKADAMQFHGGKFMQILVNPDLCLHRHVNWHVDRNKNPTTARHPQSKSLINLELAANEEHVFVLQASK